MHCWARGTYFEGVAHDGRRSQPVSYYQWTPLMLLACALAFNAPCVLWRLLGGRSGVHLVDIVALSHERRQWTEARSTLAQSVAAQLGWIFKRQLRNGHRLWHCNALVLWCRHFRYYEGCVLRWSRWSQTSSL